MGDTVIAGGLKYTGGVTVAGKHAGVGWRRVYHEDRGVFQFHFGVGALIASGRQLFTSDAAYATQIGESDRRISWMDICIFVWI